MHASCDANVTVGRRPDGSPLSACFPTCLPAAIPVPFAPALLPRFHEEPWSHRPPEDEVRTAVSYCAVCRAVVWVLVMGHGSCSEGG
jgi:hypothetical protein